MIYHRLLELDLVEHLEGPWDRVHAEAEAREHVLSEDLEARIAAKLGHPTHDPHGDPIPDAEPHIDEGVTSRLSDLETGHKILLRDLAVKIGDIADRAEKAADHVRITAIKRTV